MGRLQQLADYWDDVKAYFAFMNGKRYLPLVPSLDVSERFRRIRHNYKIFQQLVDAGHASWMDCDQYEVGDWVSVFTPIEASAWHDIRAYGLPLWPQLPVGRFFLDFGNPVAKVALECDGAQWHDEAKDRRRDTELQMLGWTIYRAPGWRCNKVMERPDDFQYLPEDEQAEFWCRQRNETMRGLMEDIRADMEPFR